MEKLIAYTCTDFYEHIERTAEQVYSPLKDQVMGGEFPVFRTISCTGLHLLNGTPSGSDCRFKPGHPLSKTRRSAQYEIDLTPINVWSPFVACRQVCSFA